MKTKLVEWIFNIFIEYIPNFLHYLFKIFPFLVILYVVNSRIKTGIFIKHICNQGINSIYHQVIIVIKESTLYEYLVTCLFLLIISLVVVLGNKLFLFLCFKKDRQKEYIKKVQINMMPSIFDENNRYKNWSGCKYFLSKKVPSQVILSFFVAIQELILVISVICFLTKNEHKEAVGLLLSYVLAAITVFVFKLHRVYPFDIFISQITNKKIQFK